MIKVKDAISNIPPATLLNKCIFDNLYCNLIQRDSQQTLCCSRQEKSSRSTTTSADSTREARLGSITPFQWPALALSGSASGNSALEVGFRADPGPGQVRLYGILWPAMQPGQGAAPDMASQASRELGDAVGPPGGRDLASTSQDHEREDELGSAARGSQSCSRNYFTRRNWNINRPSSCAPGSKHLRQGSADRFQRLADPFDLRQRETPSSDVRYSGRLIFIAGSRSSKAW